MANENPPPDPDPEKGWPPRFDDPALRYGTFVLVALFVVVATGLWATFLRAHQFDGDNAAKHTIAYALYVIGLLALLAGVLFALIEARKPPPVIRTAPRHRLVPVFENGPQELALIAEHVDALGTDFANVGRTVTSVVDGINGRRVSSVLIGIAIVLFTFATAGSGFIDVSVATGDAATTPASPSAAP